MDKLDTLPYKTFLDLKKKFPVKTIVVGEGDLTRPGVHQAFKNHVEYVEHQFKQIGVKIYRLRHDYDSLSTSDPRLGLVYMVNDSTIVPGIEVHALIGHNATYISEA